MPMVRVSNGGSGTIKRNCSFSIPGTVINPYYNYCSSSCYDTGITGCSNIGIIGSSGMKIYDGGDRPNAGIPTYDITIDSTTGRATFSLRNASSSGYKIIPAYPPVLDIVVW